MSEGRRVMLLAGVACVMFAAALGGVGGTTATGGRAAGASVYEGLGSWVDIFAESARRQPEQVVAALRAHGVTTLYLETSNYSHPQAVIGPRTAAASSRPPTRPGSASLR